MSKYLRGDSHSLHREHGFSWEAFSCSSLWGFHCLVVSASRKRFGAQGWGLLVLDRLA